jgi:hypothetical protein
MKYPAPRKLLNYLASHGPSAVQVEALAMLGRPDLPTTFPAFPRGSRENFLRRLAANPKKATSARLGALKELLQLMLGETPEPRCSGGFSNLAVARTRILQGSQLQIAGLSKGDHYFQCCIHPWMRVKVEVQDHATQGK